MIRKIPRAALLGLATLSLLLLPSDTRAAALWSVGAATVTTASTDQLMAHGYGASAADQSGGIYVVWADSRNLATTGINVYAQHLDSNGNPVSGWPANGLQLSTTRSGTCINNFGSRDAICPGVTGDGAGGAFITWQDWRNNIPQAFAQRVSAAGTALWTAGGVLVATAPATGRDEAGGPILTSDGSLFVILYDSAPLVDGGLIWRVQKLNPADGAQLFGPEGKVITTTTVQSFTGAAFPLPDSSGGFFYAWGDKRAGAADSNAYAFRVDSSGNRSWEIVLSSAANDQGLGIVTTGDDAGGFYALWVDSRAGGTEVDLYGTRVKSDGTAYSGWSIGATGGNGVAVSTGWQYTHEIDHYGNDLLAVWWDLHDGSLAQKIKAQRMSGATGSALWTADGVSLITPTTALATTLAAPVIRTSSNSIFAAFSWGSMSFGCGSVCSSEVAVGQALNPADGSILFSSTGTYLGPIGRDSNYLPRAFQAVASTGDASAIFAWISGGLGNTDLYAQKLSAGGGGGGQQGGGGTTTALSPFLAVVSSDALIAQWTDIPGSSFIAALSTDSFTTLAASGTVSTFRSTYTSLSPQTTYYFKVKLSTEPDTAYSSLLSRRTSASGLTPPAFSIGWASTGTSNGQIIGAYGVAADASGNVYVVDKDNSRIQKFDNSGVFISSWGGFGSGNGQFNRPYGVAADASGNVYVTDYFNSRIQKFDSAGNFLAKWGSQGSGNGQFLSLAEVAADSSGNVYTTERGNHRVQKFDSNGTFLTKWGSQGTTDGKLDSPWGIGVDASGVVYVADGSNGISKKNHRIQKFDSNGNFLAKWGDLGTFQGLLDSPRDLAVDASGYVYVADFFNKRVLKFDPNGSLLYALGSSGSTDGKFISVTGVAVDSAGNVFATDASTRTNQVQKFGSTVLSAGPSAPTGLQFTAVTTGSVSVSWTLVGGHSYLMALSTNSDFSATVSSGTGALSQNTTSYAALSPGTYYFKVKVSTHPDSLYSSAISTTVTGPPSPPAPTGVSVTHAYFQGLRVQWDLSSGNSYLMALSTDSAFSSVVSSAVGALDQNTTTYGRLQDRTTYYFKVKISTNPDASYSAAVSTAIPSPRAPAGAQFTSFSTPTLSVQWTLESGNSYVIVLSTVSSFATTFSSAAGILNQNTTTFAGVATGTYYFKVKIATHPDTGYSTAISTSSGQSPGYTQSQPISAASTAQASLNPVTGPINFSIPAGAFGASNNTLTTSLPAVVPGATTGSSGKVTPLGPAFDISLAQPVQRFSQPLSVDVKVPSLPAAVNPANVRLAWYDAYFNIWWPIWESYYNAALQIVYALLYHNTTFAVVVVESSPDLDSLKVFPNPVNFGSSVRNTVKFSGLTAQPTIRIYDMAGELVISIPPGFNADGTVNDGTSGLAEWNGKNEDGGRVARGTYLFVITDPSGKRRTGKIGVIR